MSDPNIPPSLGAPVDPNTPSFSQQDFNEHLRNYLVIFGSLLLLTLISFSFWYFQVRLGVQIVLTLLIAATQAFLNLRYLMHLKGQGGTIKYFLIMTAVFSALLLAGSIVDVFNPIPGTHH